MSCDALTRRAAMKAKPRSVTPWMITATGKSSHSQLGRSPVRSMSTKSRPKAGTVARNSVSATDIGRMARGKCRARTMPSRPVIALAPRVMTDEVKPNITTPMLRNPTKFSIPPRVLRSRPKIRK